MFRLGVPNECGEQIQDSGMTSVVDLRTQVELNYLYKYLIIYIYKQ